MSNQEYFQRQEDTLNNFRELIKKQPQKNIEALREIERSIFLLREDAKSCKSEDLPSIMYQLNIQHNLANKLSEGNAIPNIKAPFFGHMRIKQGDVLKDIYLGHVAYTSTKLNERIIDWKKAPLAKIFYQYDETEDFDFDLDDREIEGTVIQKSVLTIVEGKLLRIDRNGESFIKSNDTWIDLNEEHLQLEGGENSSYGEFGTGRTNFDSPDVISLLDKTQFDLVNRDMTKPLLIIGGAGSGKTTVALFRLARLAETNKIFPNQALVLVPNAGLVKLSKILLNKIGLNKAKVQTLDLWLEQISRKMVKHLPRNINKETPLSVSITKRCPQVRDLLELYVKEQSDAIEKELSKFENDETIRYYQFLSNLPLIPRLNELSKKLTDKKHILRIQKIIENHSNFREDVFHIFTSDKYLSLLKEKCPDLITNRMIDEVKMHSAKTISRIDTDRNYLVKEGSETEESNPDSIDLEDYPLLLNLIQIKNGNVTEYISQSKKFKQIVLDEAQEVSALELNIIREFIHEKGSITVAGDAVKQIDPSVSFGSWNEVMNCLGQENTEVSELNVSYRSPRAIIEFSHKVLGPLAPKDLPESKKKGGPIIETQIQHHAHASITLNNSLRNLLHREPSATIAIICNTEATAKSFYDELQDLGSTRLVLDSEFSFKPGVDITVVDNIRGLEFDYVIIPDADRGNYPNTPTARKRLHLGATRAIHQLWVMFTSDKSPLY